MLLLTSPLYFYPSSTEMLDWDPISLFFRSSTNSPSIFFDFIITFSSASSNPRYEIPEPALLASSFPIEIKIRERTLLSSMNGTILNFNAKKLKVFWLI